MALAFAAAGAPLRLRTASGARSAAVCRRRPRACAEPPAAAKGAAKGAASETTAGGAAADAGDDGGQSYLVVPGKVVLNELELAAQRTRLDELGDRLKQERLVKEYNESRKFGFVDYAEKLNGRTAAFFFVTGLLTEYWTGYTIPQQIELMLNTVGVF